MTAHILTATSAVIRPFLASAGLAVFASVPVLAHHSSAGFEAERTIELSGTVKEFQWTNPHIWIELNVTNSDGAVEQWSVEGGVPNRLFRAGWRPDAFKPGDEVTLVVRPMKNGARAGIFVGAKRPDGSTLGRFPETH